MVLFNEVKEEFEKHNCKLLMTEEEFNIKPRITNEKYNYTASCGHNHIINFTDFKRKQNDKICPKCSKEKQSINQIKLKYKDVKEEFEKHKCCLLMTEEEFNQKPRLFDEKYKYTASCGHNHIIIIFNLKKTTR